MINKNPYTTGQKSLTRKQAESVIMAANSYEDKVLVLIGFTLGLRRDDIVRVELQNINFQTNEFSYLERKKGNRIKTVPMTERLSNELRVYINSHVKPGQKYLFPPRQETSKKNVKNPETKEVVGREKFLCEYLSSKTAYNIFNALCKRAGVATPIPIHAMRSTCIKLKQEEGWTIEQVAALIGDKVSTVQEHYSTPSGGELAVLMKEKAGI
jgi:integrase